MARTSKLLTEEIVELAESGLKRLGKSGAVAIKLRAIVAANKHGITAVAAVFDTTKATLISWIKNVKDESFKLLTVQAGRGRKSILSKDSKEIIKQWVTEDSQITINKLKQKIMMELGIDLGRSTIHRLMKELKFSYITPRPRHYKQDQATIEESKKKSGRRN